MENVVNQELLGHGVRPGVHGTYGGPVEEDRVDSSVESSKGVPGGWEVEDLQ